MPLLHASMDVFQNLIEKNLPELASYFAVNDIMLSSFATPWFHTLFSWRFPLSLVARLFDIVLREGLTIVFRFGIALLKNRLPGIVALDPNEALMKLQNVEWLLDEKLDDEWIALALRVKKTREMYVTELATPLFRNSIMSLAKKMGSSLKLIAAVSPIKPAPQEYESGGPMEAAIWKMPDDGSVVVSAEGEIVAATAEKLVERVTAARFAGQQFTEAFLLTFRGFLVPARLALLLKWRLQHIPILSGQSKAEWTKESVEPIHRRVFNLLRLWITLYPRDFDADIVMSEVEGSIGLLAAHSVTMAERIRRTLAVRPRPSRPAHPSSLRLSNQDAEAATILQWSPDVFARALLSADWKLYQSVLPIHLLALGGSVQSVVRWNARLSCFIESRVLTLPDRESCVKQMEYFLAVAEASLAINNLSGAVVLVLALRSVLKLFKDAALTKGKMRN